MLSLLYIIFLNVIISYCYDIINLSHYERKTVKFSPKNTFYVFKYAHIIVPNVNGAYLTINNVINKNTNEYKFYLYNDVKNITQKNGEFINYYKKGLSKSSFIYKDNPSHEYYLVVQYADNNELEETFYIFSSDSPYEVKSIFYEEYYISEENNIQNYIFSVSSNHKKYVKFGLINQGNSGDSSLTVIDMDSN